MTNIGITQELVCELFDYRNGVLYWKVRPAKCIHIGDRAGSFSAANNRWSIEINNKSYPRARLIFLWHHGWLPNIVDHRDRITVNDKIENLRAANHSQNSRNRTSHKNSTSKYLGVALSIEKSKRFSTKLNEWVYYTRTSWRACISVNGQSKILGRFKTEIEAAICYNEAAKIHHKEFANLNIIE